VVTGSKDLAEVLSDPSSSIDRDLRFLLLSLFGKCRFWDEDPSVAISDEDLHIDGVPYESLGVAYAAASTFGAKGIAAITANHAGFQGIHNVTFEQKTTELCFVRRTTDCKLFYRTLYKLENVPEKDFFALAEKAFPDLRFAVNLTFSKFDGGYSCRPLVVKHLSILNDDFLKAYSLENGNSARISARIGVDVSIEGGTRSSERLMSLRDVEFDGQRLRCEWHSKLEPHRNRIHFYPGDSATSGATVIGIFVNHLQT
jgi:hypothetical protein